MVNSNGLSSVGGALTALQEDGALTAIKSEDGKVIYGFKDKQAYRRLASSLYPTIIVGAEGSSITSANFSSQPSGEIASSYLLTALEGGSTNSAAGASSMGDLVDDVVIIPSTVTLNMLGNVCMSRGQVYYVDFTTGTTVDNSYAVQAVTHSIRPGSFTTTATLAPVNSVTMRTLERQIGELTTLLEKS
jgi:hypothetical protein